jgi:hypothetical protein
MNRSFRLSRIHSCLLITYGRDMTPIAEKRVVDSLFANETIVVLREKSHYTFTFDASWIFGVLQPHRDSAERGGIFQTKRLRAGERRKRRFVKFAHARLGVAGGIPFAGLDRRAPSSRAVGAIGRVNRTVARAVQATPYPPRRIGKFTRKVDRVELGKIEQQGTWTSTRWALFAVANSTRHTVFGASFHGHQAKADRRYQVTPPTVLVQAPTCTVQVHFWRNV